MRWAHNRGQERCRVCRKAKAKQGKWPECEGCKNRPPDILPANRPAWKLWCLCATQWRVGTGGPVGLDYTAVALVADRHRICLTAEVLGKIRTMEATVLNEQRCSH